MMLKKLVFTVSCGFVSEKGRSQGATAVSQDCTCANPGATIFTGRDSCYPVTAQKYCIL